MKYVIAAGILIIIGFIVALQFIPIGIEPLSEVYFENHTSLPTNIFLNRTYNFSFSVHNLEYRPMKYDYNISGEYGDEENMSFVQFEKGEFELANNETLTFAKNFSFKKRFERAKVLIEVIKDNNESIDIHFWVDEIMPIKISIEKENLSLTNNTLVNASLTNSSLKVNASRG